MKETMCSGCGRLGSEGKVKLSAIACCPDNDYIEIPEKLVYWIKELKDCETENHNLRETFGKVMQWVNSHPKKATIVQWLINDANKLLEQE